ncbi:nuclear transport factor 2-like protein [Flavobacterium silvaticum]|uniref:Nuclear transport factor 2 family protein n=1 Tax=Flavobacterium silvaticum TaxID=1852020 RepID=A0A972FNS2_9FLAO|nr:hypothetical protein [Flavobacterium silvaticum]NMH26644.1 nuclear transport factor 2 family protein [Flavobacterium silvaticum]
MEKTTFLLEDSLFKIWNNRNATERLSEMARIYAADIHFYESDDSEPFIGFEAINNLISNLQSQWAPEFAFQTENPVQVNHDMEAASWHLGIPGQNPVAGGMDVALVENGKIKKLYLYLNK